MKKIIILLILIPIFSYGQNLSELTEQNLFRGGNVFLLDKLNKYDNDIDGTPYLNPDFDKGQIIFENGNSYGGEIRIDLVAQNFQIKGKNGKITPIEVNDKVKIEIKGKKYKLHAISSSEYGDIGILRECIELENISLYFFPRKKLQKPIEAGISAPTSGYGKTDNPEWKDDGFYFFLINQKYLRVPTKYKKLVELKLFDNNKLKSFRKTNKLDLRKEQKLIELVKYFNEN
tara:strand:- start:711 stop:1403 length:693 start_codon:yes stop_codon:yes gene_type:complete